MRTVVISIVCIVCILFVVMIQSAVNSKATREAELRDGLDIAITQTMKELMKKNRYGIEDRKGFVGAFLQSLLLKVNSDMSLRIRIISLDMEEGLMDVEVQGTFDYFKGKKKTILVRRTVIFEQETSG